MDRNRTARYLIHSGRCGDHRRVRIAHYHWPAGRMRSFVCAGQLRFTIYGLANEEVVKKYDCASGLVFSNIVSDACRFVSGLSRAQTNAAKQVLKPRIGPERVKTWPHEDLRVKALRKGLLQPDHCLVLLVQSYVDQSNYGCI